MHKRGTDKAIGEEILCSYYNNQGYKLSTFQPLHSMNVPVKIRFKSGGTKISW